jgi:hypothetical protein
MRLVLRAYFPERAANLDLGFGGHGPHYAGDKRPVAGVGEYAGRAAGYRVVRLAVHAG